MKHNLSAAMRHVLAVEGDFSDHLRDTGGPTKYGVTLSTLRQWRAAQGLPEGGIEELRALSLVEAERIYAGTYWLAAKGDELPPGLDLMVFDAAVHAGPGQSARWLQAALNREGAFLKVDGVLGSKTVEAARNADAAKIIRHLARYRILEAMDDPSDAPFGRGWIDRIIATTIEAMKLVSRETPPRWHMPDRPFVPSA